jgi:O-antigen ligase
MNTLQKTHTPLRVPGVGVIERLVFFLPLLILLWAPLPAGSNRPWSASLLVLLIALVFLLWLFLLWRRGTLLHSQALSTGAPLVLLLLLVQLWVLAQLLFGWSYDRAESLQYLLLGLAYSLFFVLILGVFSTRERVVWLLAALLVSGTFQAFFGALMVLSGTEWSLFEDKQHYRSVVTGTFVSRNHLAGYLEMTLAAGIGLLMALRDGRGLRWRTVLELLVGPKVVIRLSLLVMVIALVLSHSRMGNVAFFSSLLIVGGFFVLLNPHHRLRNSIILTSLVLLDLLIISQHFGLEGLQQRLENTQLRDQIEERVVQTTVVDAVTGTQTEQAMVERVVVREANEQRPDVNIYAWPMLQQRLWTGWGAGAFEATFQPFVGAEIQSHYDHAHNDLLQFPIEFGVVGTGFLAAFVLLAFYHAFQAMRQQESLFRSGMAVGVLIGLLSLMIHSATDFNLQIPANALTFITLAALAVLARRHT